MCKIRAEGKRRRVTNTPLRLLDCFRLVMALGSAALEASAGEGWGLRAAFLEAAEGWSFGVESREPRKRAGDEMAMASAMCGGSGAGSVPAPGWRAVGEGSWGSRRAERGGRRRELFAVWLDGNEVVSKVESSAQACCTPVGPVSGKLAQSAPIADHESVGNGLRGMRGWTCGRVDAWGAGPPPLPEAWSDADSVAATATAVLQRVALCRPAGLHPARVLGHVWQL